MMVVELDEPLSKFLLRRLVFSMILILIPSYFAVPSLCSGSSSTSAADQKAEDNDNNHSSRTSDLATCLVDYGVNNFTLFPGYTHQHHHGHVPNPEAYYTFLNFPIQNLRFTEPSVPKPTAIIMPETKHQLVNAVLCCIKLGSWPWEIRVRSGGHSYEGTSSVAADGSPFVIIDLMNLNRISVDLKSQVAWVEGGATVGQTYYAISEASKYHGFSAGSCPTVGVGGHISGGGFGFLSRKYGVAADNVEDALLVDAEGRVLDRKAMGEQVFWAIRGGGGGIWGIIYAWKIKLVKVPPTVTAFTLSRPGTKNYVGRLVEKWQHVAPKLSDDFYLSVAVASDSSETEPTVEVAATFDGLFLGTKRGALSALIEVFPELRLREGDCKEMSWIGSVVYFSGLEPIGNSSTIKISQLKDRHHPHKSFFKAKSDYVRTPIPITGIRTAIDVLHKEPNGYVIFDPYGGVMERIRSESIAFPHRRGNLFCIQYMVDWEEKDQYQRSDGYLRWIRGFYDSMAPFVSSAPRAAYVNYVDLDLGVMNTNNNSSKMGMLNPMPVPADAVEMARVWGEKYFLSNYDRLVRAKTLIDPLNVFRNQQGIPPLPKPS